MSEKILWQGQEAAFSVRRLFGTDGVVVQNIKDKSTTPFSNEKAAVSFIEQQRTADFTINRISGIDERLAELGVDTLKAIKISGMVWKGGKLVRYFSDTEVLDVPVEDFWAAFHTLARVELSADSEVAFFITDVVVEV